MAPLTPALHRIRDTQCHRMRSYPYSLVKQPSSFPRRVFCARGLLFASLTRNEGWAEHRETYGRSCEAPVRRVRTRQALVRRLASLVRGTLASRRSTVAILGPGPRFPHRTCVRIGHSELLASGS